MSSDRPKRPSARPSARPVAPTKPSAPEANRAAPRAESNRSSDKSRVASARVSARRTSPPAAPATPARKTAVKAKGADKRAKPGVPTKGAVAKGKDGEPRRARAPAAPSSDAHGNARSSSFGSRPDSRAPTPSASRAVPRNSIPPAAPLARPSREDGDVYSAQEAENGPLTALVDLSSAGDRAESAEAGNSARLLLGSGAERRAQEAFSKGSQSLLSSDYYVRQYGAHGLRNLSAEVDEYGLDPHVEERARPWLELLSTRYFRLDLEGAERVPESGRALLVCNRSGSVPWDGLMLRTALRTERPTLQPLRWLSEDSVIHYPFLGTFMNRLGAVRACPENAERMLSQDRLVAVFPEGAQGSQKLFKDRYRLQRFGRGGYVRLALKLGAPILPTAIIGAEEVNPLLGRLSLFGRGSRGEGGDFLPITPTFPWLGPLGLLPAPVKWRVIVGDPVDLSGYGPGAADDALVVHRLNEQIRGILQALIDQAQESRKSVLFG